MYGFIHINGEKVEIACCFGYSKKIEVYYKDDNSTNNCIFIAEYSLKGDTVALKPYNGEYLIDNYKTIKLTMTLLD